MMITSAAIAARTPTTFVASTNVNFRRIVVSEACDRPTAIAQAREDLHRERHLVAEAVGQDVAVPEEIDRVVDGAEVRSQQTRPACCRGAASRRRRIERLPAIARPHLDPGVRILEPQHEVAGERIELAAIEAADDARRRPSALMSATIPAAKYSQWPRRSFSRNSSTDSVRPICSGRM